MKNIGLIGVGLMGHGIAKNIATKGWSLTYLDHPGNQPTDDIDRAGARRLATAAEVASASDVIILCVTGSPQVEDVLTGSGAMLAALRPGAIVVDCSTALPSSTQRLASLVAARGATFVDAPMTRTPKEADEGRLNLLVGGDPEVVDGLRPLLSAFAENIFHAGGTGTGHQLKLVHNFVSLGTVTLIAEALACAAEGGIETGTLLDCLRLGGGGGVALDRLIPYVTNGETQQLRFTIANASKDLTYYNQMAAELGSAHPVAAAVKGALDDLVQRGAGGSFMPEQVTLLRR